MKNQILLCSVASLIAGCATPSRETASVAFNEIAPSVAACPDGPPPNARCWRGVDSAGAPYIIAMPAQWSGVLVVHAHGGPSLGAPSHERADEDMKRWSIIVKQGHAYAASVFRQGGFAVTTAAEDTERVRQVFVNYVSKPKQTILHGQSWGAMVATRSAELFPTSWDGILLTSGVVAGPATYDFRLDIRAVYQNLCGNHPRPSEPQYPLSIGLPMDSKLTNAELSSRVNECLALNKPAAQRTPEQQAKIKTLVDVIRTPENSLMSHLNWGTFTLRDVVRRHGGPVTSNHRVRYAGSLDDVALNAALDKADLRFVADPKARQSIIADVDHAGKFAVPVIAAHGVNDSTVFVEGSDTLKSIMQASGNGARLVQTYVDSSEHSYWGDEFYPPLFEALTTWVNQGVKPSPVGIAQRCQALSASPCKFLPNYQPKPLSSRVPER